MKTAIALALGMLLASSALAGTPQKRNEVFIGAGTGPVVFVFEEIGDVFVDAAFHGGGSYRNEGSDGTQLVVGYQHRFNRWLGAGMSGSWVRLSNDLYREGEHAKLSTTTRQMMTAELNGRLHWVDWRWGGLYSNVGLGVAARNYEYTDEEYDVEFSHDWSHVALNLIPLGVRLGGDVGGHLEIGGFTNSWVTAGLSYRF
jgi:hypothetical protein